MENNLQKVDTSDLIQEVHRRIEAGKVHVTVTVSLLHTAFKAMDNQLQEERDKCLDVETALVAALGKKTAMYGDETRDQFIRTKLRKWHGKLRFNFSKETR